MLFPPVLIAFLWGFLTVVLFDEDPPPLFVITITTPQMSNLRRHKKGKKQVSLLSKHRSSAIGSLSSLSATSCSFKEEELQGVNPVIHLENSQTSKDLSTSSPQIMLSGRWERRWPTQKATEGGIFMKYCRAFSRIYIYYLYNVLT